MNDVVKFGPGGKAICSACDTEMVDGGGCVDMPYAFAQDGGNVLVCRAVPNGKETRYGPIPLDTCHDCGAGVGGLHHPGCDWEECPRCHLQALGCPCFEDTVYVDTTGILPEGVTVQEFRVGDARISGKGILVPV